MREVMRMVKNAIANMNSVAEIASIAVCSLPWTWVR